MSLDQKFTSSVPSFSFIQTFFADPAAVQNSSEFSLTSVWLFVKEKPSVLSNGSGTLKPGITLCICEVRDDRPILTRVHSDSFVRLGYDEIPTATIRSITPNLGGGEAKFYFNTPIKLTSGRTYGIVVITEDPAYTLHENKKGDVIIGGGISNGSSSLGSFIPKLYRGSNSGVFTPINATDLAIVVKTALYNANTATVELVNKSYEFLSIDSRNKNFVVGERAFQQTANAAGSIAIQQGNTTIRGTGTNFSGAGVTANSFIVITANAAFSQVVRVASVANTTQLVLADIPRFSNTAGAYKVTPTATVNTFDQLSNKVTLIDSTAANATFRFNASNTIFGDVSGASANISSVDNYSVDSFVPKLDITLPSSSQINATYNFTAQTGGNFAFSPSNVRELVLDAAIPVVEYDAYVLSRSNEIANTSFTQYGADRKSAVLTVSVDSNTPTTRLYTSPTIAVNELDIFVGNNSISNTHTSTDANSVVFDTEVTNRGIALTRHISTKVNFAENRRAEDVRVFLLGYRPIGTQIKVYAKILNLADPETFDDKLWTPLEIVANQLKFSSLDNLDDLIEYEYGLPLYPESAQTLTALATTQAGNNQIVMSSNPTSQVANNNLIKIYDPRLPDNYEVAVATSVNSSVIVTSTPITNNNVIGSGLRIDRLKYYNTAFNNLQNDNISRYYNTSMAAFDKYDSMQIKIVLLSDNTYNIPKVEQVQVIGVSA